MILGALLLANLLVGIYLVMLFKRVPQTINDNITENGITELDKPETPPSKLEDPNADGSVAGTIHVKGTIREEKIPPELELGDTWFWFYFDEPYYQEQNAVGYPIYIDKIQISDNAEPKVDLAKYKDKHVQLDANQTWGYAESEVFEAFAVTVIN